MGARFLRRAVASLAIIVLAVACSAASPTGPLTDTAPPTAEPSSRPSMTVAPSSPAPSPTIDPELGVQPDPQYPEVQAVGIGTLEITSPRADTARFWLTCEWSTTARVAWLYPDVRLPIRPGGISLFGEPVTPDIFSLLDGDPRSFRIERLGDVAFYAIDESSAATLTNAPDWTSGALTFEHLRLAPEQWYVGPLPTPRASFERPLGGDPAALDLAGSFEWTCGPLPASVPTPGPPRPPEPTAAPLKLPGVTLTADGESRRGIRGCGGEWGTGGEVGAGAQCGGPAVPVPPFASRLPSALDVPDGVELVFSLPAGYHFEAWTYEYVDQATAEYFRGAEPTGVIVAERDRSTTAKVVTVPAPPPGDWMIRFKFGATDGDTVVRGMPVYFRVDVR